MAGIVKQLVGQFYEMEFKLSGAVAIKQGGFVVPDYANGEFDIPADDAIGEIYFVANEVVYSNPHGKDDAVFAVEGGEYVKAKPVIDKEVFLTDMITSVYAGISKGDEVGVGADGKVALIADLTAIDFTTFRTTFLVKDKVKYVGQDALILVAKVK